MKTKILTLALSFLSLGALFNSPSLNATESTVGFDIPSPVNALYNGAKIAGWVLTACVVYKAYTNPNISRNLGKIYSFITSGDTVAPEVREEIQTKKALRHKDAEATAETVKEHTIKLNVLCTGIDALRLASKDFATKADLKNLVTKTDFEAFEQRMNAKLETVIAQTRTQAIAEAVFKLSKNK
jgi:hypothetical protein